ncbi:MAG: hypothetical protein KHW62_03060 [Clostridiales bacterium]|nr:hypothetical protein [Clostridiales bacterium]
MDTKKKIKIAIAVLSILLAISVVAVAVRFVYDYVTATNPIAELVPDNIIENDADLSDTDLESDNDLEGDDSDSEEESDNSGENVTGESVEGEAPGASEAGDPSEVIPTDGENAEKEAEVLYLYDRNPGDNTPFNVTNMFPGDIETKYFLVRVVHKGDIILRFHAEVRPGYEKLAEVLKCRVVLPESGDILYDGLMRDMPESLNVDLQTDSEITSEAYYEITAYLETSVGNEYMQTELVADFTWWVEETDNLGPANTSDGLEYTVWIIVAAASLIIIIILAARLRKGESFDER